MGGGRWEVTQTFLTSIPAGWDRSGQYSAGDSVGGRGGEDGGDVGGLNLPD